jgi:hypothetical protein
MPINSKILLNLKKDFVKKAINHLAIKLTLKSIETKQKKSNQN